MYKVLKVGEEAWQVFWVESPDTEPVPIPHTVKGKAVPYSKRQAAYRRCKKLNDAIKQINEQVARDGAIIL